MLQTTTLCVAVLGHEERSVAKSFRVRSDAIEALHEEAQKRQISLNTLVNQLLVNYAEYGRYIKQMRGIVLTPLLVADLVNAVPDDKLAELARNWGKTTPKTMIESKHGKMTLNGLIDFIHDASAYGNAFEYSEKNENDHLTITLTHELGRKWSVILTHYFEQAMAGTGVKANFSTGNNHVAISV